MASILDFLKAAVPLAAGAKAGWDEGQGQQEDKRVATARQSLMDQMKQAMDTAQIGEVNARGEYYKAQSTAKLNPKVGFTYKVVRNPVTGQDELQQLPTSGPSIPPIAGAQPPIAPGTDKSPGGSAGPAFDHDAAHNLPGSPNQPTSPLQILKDSIINPNDGGRGGDEQEGAALAAQTLPPSPTAQSSPLAMLKAAVPPSIGAPTGLVVPPRAAPKIDPNSSAAIAAKLAAKISTDSARVVNTQKAKRALPAPSTARVPVALTDEGRAKSRGDFIARQAPALMKPTLDRRRRPIPSPFASFDDAKEEAAYRWDVAHGIPHAHATPGASPPTPPGGSLVDPFGPGPVKKPEDDTDAD